MKRLPLASVIAVGALAFAASSGAAESPASGRAETNVAQANITADSRQLIGRNVQNLQGETIGEIKSVQIGRSGEVENAIVGVGGFLGLGEREIAIPWKELKTLNSDKIVINATKESLKAMPEYRYPDPSYRGTVFADTRTVPPTTPPSATTPPAGKTAAAPTATNKSTRNAMTRNVRGDFDATGGVSAHALVGATVKNATNQSIGKIENVFIGPDGQVKHVIVSVGGFLGLGDRNVALAWSDLKLLRENDKLVVASPVTKETLQSLPEYK